MNPILRTVPGIDWLTLLLFGSLLLVLFAKRLHYVQFLHFLILPFNNKYVFMYSKPEKRSNRFHILLTLFQIINTSIFIFTGYSAFVQDTPVAPISLFLPVFLGVFAFFTLKILFQRSNAFVFGSEEVFSAILFKKLSYMNYAGVLFFVINCLTLYTTLDARIFILVGILLLIAINTMGWILVFKNHQSFFASYFFYFILYLCTLEIAPIAIIANLLK